MTVYQSPQLGIMSGAPSAPPGLSDLFQGIGQMPPQTVSPGSPAPMQSGVQLAAPPPEQQQQSLQDQADALYAQTRSQAIQQLADAQKNATVDPDTQSGLDTLQQGVTQNIHDLHSDEQKAQWDRLANLGFSMAASTSPFFSQALAQGMLAANKGYDAAKADRDRQQALITDRAAQISFARAQALASAKSLAIQRLQAGQELTQGQLQLAGLTQQQILNRATMGAKADAAKAEAQKAQFEAANAPAEFGLKQRIGEAQIGELGAEAGAKGAEAGLYGAQIGKTRAETGQITSGQDFAKSYITLRNSLVNQQRLLATAALSPDRRINGPAMARKAAIDAQIQALDSKYGGVVGMGGGFGPIGPASNDPLGLRAR